MRRCIFTFAITLCFLPFAANAEDRIEKTTVFAAGESGYHTFRIPAIVETKQGTLLAFCEGRRDGGGDAGQIDLVLRRSHDGGATWSALQVVSRAEGFTTGNPAPVVDSKTGRILLPHKRHTAKDKEAAIMAGRCAPVTVWLTHSDDDGATWSPPADISSQVRDPAWRWYALGPCHGIQLPSGRLIIPCNHTTGPEMDSSHSHVIYSDDGGATWLRGGIHSAKTNESVLLALADGRLYQNMRNYRNTQRRAVAFSKDDGLTWTPAQDDHALIEPVCQASCVRYSLARNGGRNRVLFSNPASTKREKMTVRLSYDECATWPVARELWPGPSAYSDLVVTRGKEIGCLYEEGDSNPYERIAFARFTLGWLSGGRDNGNDK